MDPRYMCLNCGSMAALPEGAAALPRCGKCGDELLAMPNLELESAPSPARAGLLSETTDHHPPTPDPGLAVIGKYQLRAELGRGAFGTVYRAYDPVLEREVALKVPRFHPNQADLVERFLREARTAARLQHPHIVAVHELGQEGDRFYIASELIDGATLAKRMAAKPSHRQAAQWARDLALALHYAHTQGVIHRDIKPANILVDPNNRVRLTDFGLARWATELADPPTASEDDVAFTRVGAVVGTPAYMAPEQARGDTASVGPLSDQYSLGVVLYELVTGQRPFVGSVEQVLETVADPARSAPRLCQIDRAIPLALEAVILKALKKVPGERYATAADLAVDLQCWLKGDPVRAPLLIQGNLIRVCNACDRVVGGAKPRCTYCDADLSEVEPQDSKLLRPLSDVSPEPDAVDAKTDDRDRDRPRKPTPLANVRLDGLRQVGAGFLLVAIWLASVAALVGILNLLGPRGGPMASLGKGLAIVPATLALPAAWGLVKMYIGLFELATGVAFERLNNLHELTLVEALITLVMVVLALPSFLGMVIGTLVLASWIYRSFF